MNHEHEQDRASAPGTATPGGDTIEPGQASRSALLRRPEHAVTSGLVQRSVLHRCSSDEHMRAQQLPSHEAPSDRDANGSAHAKDAIERAARSPAQALPEGARKRFESALGTDLSAVRVHSGPESAAAASAVGAKAYTIGNDIHFAAEQYAPENSDGLHLLAHEVAHTVQHAGSTQQRHNKLEVSSPGDSSEMEADRAADAMTGGRLPATHDATVLSSKIQRQPEQPIPQKPSTAATDAAIERDFLGELRRLAGESMLAAFTNYTSAAEQVQAEMKEKEARPTLLDTLIELTVGTLAPGAANLVISRVRDNLKSVASFVIGKYVKDGDAAISAYLKADDLLNKLQLDDSKAKAGYKLLIGTMKPTTAPGPNGPPASPGATPPTGGALPVGGTGTVKVGGLIDAFQQSFNVYRQNLNAKLYGFDENALVGVYAAFDANVTTKSFYVQQIRDLIKMHDEINTAAADDGPIDGHRIIMLSAWGVTQPAIISYDIGALMQRKPNWRFVKWVEAPMMPTAIAAGRAQKGGLDAVVAGQPYDGLGLSIQGHIDNPMTEGRRVVQVDMWGRLRLCWVRLYDDPKAEFISWIPPEEEPFARVKGVQMGGIRDFGQTLKFTNSVPRPIF